jgi:uncharacterized phage-associated protein
MRVDVRALANFVLRVAKNEDVEVSNLAMNKIVYFMYVEYLVAFDRKLTSAKIEAWDHGPVFRELYAAFKKFGDSSITEPAKKMDANTGELVVCELELSNSDSDFLTSVTEKLLKYSASKLRNLSHLPGSPWDAVWNHRELINAGMEITDEIILNSNNRSWRN